MSNVYMMCYSDFVYDGLIAQDNNNVFPSVSTSAVNIFAHHNFSHPDQFNIDFFV